MCELVDLFPDVSDPGVARPSSDHHDCVDWDLVEVHCHRSSGANGMCAEVSFLQAEVVPSDGLGSTIYAVDDVLRGDVLDSAVPPDCGHGRVVI